MSVPQTQKPLCDHRFDSSEEIKVVSTKALKCIEGDCMRANAVILVSAVIMTSSTTNAQALVVYDDNQAIVLSEYLVRNDVVRGRRVLELGAGTGLPSIVAAKLFARHVTATDQPIALPLLSKNIKSNLGQDQLSAVTVLPLDWTNAPAGEQLAFDVILGADLVYNERVFEDLRRIMKQLINGDTVMLMASKIRYPKDKRFYDTLEDEFSVRRVYYDHATDVVLYRITRKREDL
ncbi:hypothetical protein NECAME_04416 [Necator americanus]|uniref:Methyltransferase small domain protein n=1 Tax=Necator americanus TaxID=51031 RepID=W2SSU8_NECAM|nr:hypothetical protein NECAME_04416 [Necator americanus]ETN72809.1 hypothetical protein NECAME_04416 [Necator americanus]